MRGRPIIFSAPMVRALLDGRKTQTRRKLSIKGRKGFFQFGPSDLPDYDWTFRRADHVWEDWRHDALLSKLPYVLGDRIWVKEHWKTDRAYEYLPPSEMGGEEPLLYLADNAVQRWGWKPDPMSRWGRHRQAMHMPRWASRLTLTVTDVRVQRLQDIGPDDAISEGISRFDATNLSEDESGPVWRFGELWNTIHGSDAWDANPWVAAYTFTVHRGNIDQVDT